MAVIQHRAQAGIPGLTADTVWTTQNLTPGTVLWSFVYWDSNTATVTSFADPDNGAWTPIGSPQVGGGGAITTYQVQMFVKFGNVSTGKPTTSATFSTTRSDSGICLFELSNGPTIVEASNYATSAIANPSQSLTPNFSADAVCCFIFCESSAASAIGGGFTILESVNMGGNPAAANTAPTGGSPATASWTSVTQNTVLGMAILGNPVGAAPAIYHFPHASFGPF